MPNRSKKLNRLEELSMKVTNWMGTPYSIVAHTIGFGAIFLLKLVGLEIDQIMLILTTAVSLEAIYLSLFIQMTVNRNTASLEEVEEDIDEIQEDVEVIEGEFAEIHDEVEEISEDIEEMQADDEKEESEDEKRERLTIQTLKNIEEQMRTLTNALGTLKGDIEVLKKKL